MVQKGTEMRWVLLMVVLGACVQDAPTQEMEPEVPEVMEPEPEDTVDECFEIAESFCVRAVECFPSFSKEWCLDVERPLCDASWNYDYDACLADIELMECRPGVLAVPCSCNPDQTDCE